MYNFHKLYIIEALCLNPSFTDFILDDNYSPLNSADVLVQGNYLFIYRFILCINRFICVFLREIALMSDK